MQNMIKRFGLIALVVAIVFGFAACPDGGGNNDGDNNGGGGGGGGGNQTPVASDYTFGNMSQMGGNVTPVTITPKNGKSGGAITIYYEWTTGETYTKSKVVQQGAGTYAVTFDVAAATGWNAATGLSAGNLTVNPGIPVAGDYTFDKMTQMWCTVTAVQITPKNGKSPGLISAVYYEGTNGTSYDKNTEIPQETGTYAVTFNVAEATGWNGEEGLAAGNLVVKQWTAVTDSTFGSTTSINGVAYGGGKWVAVSGEMAYSADGVTWTAVTGNGFLTVAYGGGKWVAGGGPGKICHSADGITWTEVTIYAVSGTIMGVAYGGAAGSEKFVAVTKYYSGSSNIAYSPDGITWTANSAIVWFHILGVAYGGGKFVAVGGDGEMAYSADGVTWTAVTNSTFGSSTSINGVAYGGDKFVAVGGAGRMAYSADGVTWTEVTNSTFDTTAINAVTYGGGRWVAVGNSGKMAYSADGITWTAVTNNTFGTYFISDVAYGGAAGSEKWVAVGGAGKMAWSEN